VSTGALVKYLGYSLGKRAFRKPVCEIGVQFGRRECVETQGGVADKIGLMGWSQGATAAMVAMGATPIDSKTLRTEASTKPFKGAVAFYPGSGFKYGKNTWAFNGTSYSYWRLYAPMRINRGSHDKLYDAAYVKETDTIDLDSPPDIRHHCGIRVDRQDRLRCRQGQWQRGDAGGHAGRRPQFRLSAPNRLSCRTLPGVRLSRRCPGRNVL
jgi:hypothetical protein